MEHTCTNNLEYETTIDIPLPYGYIYSMNVYVCKVCGELFTEKELEDVKCG